MIALARLNVPSIFVYGGTIKPGHYQGRDLTIVSAFEAVGQHTAHKIDDHELLEVERHACPAPVRAVVCTQPTPCHLPSRQWE